MNEIPYKNMSAMSDEAIEKKIGHYIKKVRQQQNKTQQEVANAASISRSTLSLLERGESGNLKTLIQILRVLDKLQTLKAFEYEEQLSPIALAKAQHKSKKRIRPTKKSKSISTKKKSNW